MTTHTIHDGGIIRRLRPVDTPHLIAHLLRLDEQGRRNRFQGLVSDRHVELHAARALAAPAIVFGFVAPEGGIRGVGELHPEPGIGGPEGEAAFSVESGLRGHGLGTELFRHVLAAARELGLGRVVLHCLSSNLAMQALCQHVGATVRREEFDLTAYVEPDALAPAELQRIIHAA